MQLAFYSWIDRQIRHSFWVWQWQMLFLLWLPNFRKFCMSKHSCSYVIIVPWNNIQERLLISIFLCREDSGESVHLHRLTWVFVLVLKYHVLAQITIYVPFIRTVNAVVRLPQQTQELCATISALYQCVKKCPQCVVIKNLNITFASLPKKKKSSNRFFGCYFMGIWQQLRLDVQISLSLGSYTRKKHLSRQNSRTLLDLQSKPWIKSPIAWQSH